MRFFYRILLCTFLFIGTSFAETINIDWMNGNEAYTQTSCTVGGDIILPTPPTRRGYTFAGWNTRKVYPDGIALPLNYDRLEYIESTGTQYIDTGIYPATAGKLYIKFMPIKVSSNYLCGTRDSNSIVFSGVGGSLTDGSINATMAGYRTNNKTTSSRAVLNNIKRVSLNIYEIRAEAVNNNKGYYTSLWAKNLTTGAEESNDNETYISNPSTIDSSITVFATGEDKIITDTRIYAYKYWNNNRKLIIDFIPCKNPQGEIGMYDTVTGQFFYNSGTGKFIAGPVVSEL